MALMLGDLTAGLKGLNAGAKSIGQQHFFRVMPKDYTAATRAAERYELACRALAGVDID